MCPVKIYAPLLPLSLCLMVGIAIGNWLSDWTWALAMLVPVLLVTCLLGKFPKGQTAAIVVCVLLLGMALGARKRQQLDVPMYELNVNAFCSVTFFALGGHHHFKEICLCIFVIGPDLTFAVIDSRDLACSRHSQFRYFQHNSTSKNVL